jgi:hypothetical protein
LHATGTATCLQMLRRDTMIHMWNFAALTKRPHQCSYVRVYVFSRASARIKITSRYSWAGLIVFKFENLLLNSRE